MTAEQLASLASSLKDNEAFQLALDNQRNGALERLATMNPDDKNGIIAMQAIVVVVDSIKGDLEQFIRSAAQAQKKPGIA